MSGPVQCAKEGAGGDGDVGRVQRAGADAAGDQRADTALVAVALGDDPDAEARRQGGDLEVRGRAFDLVDQAEDVGDRQRAQPRRQRRAVAARGHQRLEQPLDRAILAEEQQFVLAAEVVIQVAGRQVGGDCDVAHPGGGEAAGAEDAGRGADDRDPPGVGPE